MSPLQWFKGIIYPCEACHALGTIHRVQQADENLLCPACHGKGYIDKEISKVEYEEKPCPNPNCNHGKVRYGADAVEKDCPICNGLNRIMQEQTITYTEYDKCKLCKGTGVVSGKEAGKSSFKVCSSCHGLGYKLNIKKALLAAVFAGSVFLCPPLGLIYVAFGMLLFGLKIGLKKKK